jgi:hypothetical protein
MRVKRCRQRTKKGLSLSALNIVVFKAYRTKRLKERLSTTIQREKLSKEYHIDSVHEALLYPLNLAIQRLRIAG